MISVCVVLHCGDASGTLCMSTVADWTAMLDTVHRNRVSRGSRSAKGVYVCAR